jgi:hypothetical protein
MNRRSFLKFCGIVPFTRIAIETLPASDPPLFYADHSMPLGPYDNLQTAPLSMESFRKAIQILEKEKNRGRGPLWFGEIF